MIISAKYAWGQYVEYKHTEWEGPHVRGKDTIVIGQIKSIIAYDHGKVAYSLHPDYVEGFVPEADITQVLTYENNDESV